MTGKGKGKGNGRRAAGFSLLELLLAAALGVLMTVAVVQLFVANTRGYAMHGGQARLQESARLALGFLAASARSAGYMGCGGAVSLADGLDGAWRGHPVRDMALPVAGVDDVGGAGEVSSWGLGSRQVKTGSDVVLFRRIEEVGHDLAQPFHATGKLRLASTFKPRRGGLAVLSGCGKLGVLGIEKIARNGRVTLAKAVEIEELLPKGVDYGGAKGPVASVVAPVTTEIYFVARSRFVNNRGERGWSLWRRTHRADEVVSGVDDLQVLYGVDATDDADIAPQRYVPAGGIAAGVVRSIRFTVTVSSVDAVTDSDEPLTRTISQTVAVRNRWAIQ